MASINLPNNNLTFVHIPKNAGSSVVRWLEINFSDYERIPHHPSIAMLKETWDIKYSFAIVRNPWSRMVSSYFYSKQYKLHWAGNSITSEEMFPSFNEWVFESNFEIYEDSGKNFWFSIFTTNQVEWLDDSINEILKVENLDKDFLKVQQYLNCYKPLPNINTSNHEDYRLYYNDDLKKEVAKKFEKDIDTFGYTFEN